MWQNGHVYKNAVLLRFARARHVVFVIDDEARKLIYERVPSSVLRARAREMGMRTLREDGVRKVMAGLTTAEEVVRSTVADDI